MCLILCVSACVGLQVSTAARAEAEVHAWACHLSDLAHRRYENARKTCQKMNDPAAWLKALMRHYGVMQRGQPVVAAGSRMQQRSSAHVVADSLAASVQITALNVPPLPPPLPPLLGLKTLLGWQILAERESRCITEGVL
jgi:hypothetical protein